MGLGCQADEGIAHERSQGAVRDAGRMAIAGDFQSLAGEIVRVEPGINDEQPSIPQTLHDLPVGEAGTPHICTAGRGSRRERHSAPAQAPRPE